MNKYKTYITGCILTVLIPAVIVLGAVLFKEKHYAWITLCVALLSCLPLLYAFEHKERSSKEITVLAALIAISAVSRFIFAFLPGFKPVTALSVIVALYFGKEAGFVVGSLSAVISNFYFGQGPWTPFQMFAWGFIGLLAGVFALSLKRSKILLCIYGALAGVLYSITMDVWTTVWADGAFNIARFTSLVIAALPTTIEYALSNVVFLLLLSKPFGKKLDRIKIKYGLFN